MHLVGPEGFERRPDLCEQYQCLAVLPPYLETSRLDMVFEDIL